MLRLMLIRLNISLSSHISYDNRISLRSIDYYYKSRAKTQINLLIKKSTRVSVS